jgi:hypothetical protein
MPDTSRRATDPGEARFDRPVFIISCNRSGSTLLFRTLSAHPEAWSLYVEGKDIFHTHFPVDDELGDRVDTLPSSDRIRALCMDFYRRAHNKERFRDSALGGHIPLKLMQRPIGRLYKRAPLRLVEKTPSNCFRVPFLAQAFPDARFILLVRRGEPVVSSLMEGWKRWSGVRDGEAWTYGSWHYLVPPGWRDWIGRPLQEICAFQWAEANRTARRDLETYASDRTFVCRFEDMMRDPAEACDRIRDFCEFRPSAHFRSLTRRTQDRVFTTGGSLPRKAKWQDLHREEVFSVQHLLAGVLDGVSPGRSEHHPRQDEGRRRNGRADDEQGVPREPMALGHHDLVS